MKGVQFTKLFRKTEKSTTDTNKKNNISNVFIYVIGSLVLTVVACATIPYIMRNMTGFIYKTTQKSKAEKESDDDWGPVMEKKKN